MRFSNDILKLDPENEIRRICDFIKKNTLSMRRDGVVIGLSGGIDSALCSELCVKALGRENVFGLILPEKDSSPVSEKYALKQAEKIGIKNEVINIESTLRGFGTYSKRDEVIRKIFPEYNEKYKIKIALPPDLLKRDAFNFFSLTIDDGKGNTKSVRLQKAILNTIIAATNTKQRTRMMHLYYYAEKMNYLVCGTTNRSELIQGFFVKYGDGGVDIEPIAHLYKTQVYQLSSQMGVVQEIQLRNPSPDTFSYEVSDEEFFFRMPYEKLDLLLFAWENKISIKEVCQVLNLNEDQVNRAFRDFNAKHEATEHLRMLPPSFLQACEE